jgi:hypothetical protein
VMLVVGILAYVASILTIGRFIAKSSLRAMTRVRLIDGDVGSDIGIWLLFPMSAMERRSRYPICQFDFGLALVHHRTSLYSAGLACIWPIKIVANIVLFGIAWLMLKPAYDHAR